MQKSSSLVTLAPAAYLKARWVVWLHFLMGGILFATWGVEIPNIKTHYNINEADLGLLLTGVGIGALSALSIAGRIILWLGASRVVLYTHISVSVLITFLFVLPSLTYLLSAAFLFGFFASMADVAFTSEAAELELRSQKPLMSVCHGMFSLGGMLGAAFGAGLLALKVSPQWHLIIMATLIVLSALYASWIKPDDFGLKERTIETTAQKRSLLFTRPVLLLGLLACLSLFIDGAMYDWSTLYMQQELKAPLDKAALAFACFSAAMSIARFSGDKLRSHFAPAPLLVACALMVGFAISTMLLIGNPYVALLCFALSGAGLANMIPILLSVAIKTSTGSTAQTIAAVSSLGYIGLMGGPAVIGFIAYGSSLTIALYAVSVCAFIQAILAYKVLKR